MNKRNVKVGVVSALLLVSATVSAAEVGPLSYGSRLIEDLSYVAGKCVVRPFVMKPDGTRAYQEPRSLCAEIRPLESGRAIIVLNGQRFIAEVLESDLSDGGDLNHLLIRNTQGSIVARRTNVAAFGNVLIALAGGEDRILEVRE